MGISHVHVQRNNQGKSRYSGTSSISRYYLPNLDLTGAGRKPRSTSGEKSLKVNKRQRLVLLAVAAIIFLMLAFPPFYQIRPQGRINDGYSFILEPPYPRRSNIDVKTLIVQWGGVLLIGGIAFIVLKDKE